MIKGFCVVTGKLGYDIVGQARLGSFYHNRGFLGRDRADHDRGAL